MKNFIIVCVCVSICVTGESESVSFLYLFRLDLQDEVVFIDLKCYFISSLSSMMLPTLILNGPHFHNINLFFTLSIKRENH